MDSSGGKLIKQGPFSHDRQGDPCGQTQTATAVDGNRAIWNHPLSAHFAVRSPLGWPKFVLNIQQIDEVRA